MVERSINNKISVKIKEFGSGEFLIVNVYFNGDVWGGTPYDVGRAVGHNISRGKDLQICLENTNKDRKLNLSTITEFNKGYYEGRNEGQPS